MWHGIYTCVFVAIYFQLVLREKRRFLRSNNEAKRGAVKWAKKTAKLLACGLWKAKIEFEQGGKQHKGVLWQSGEIGQLGCGYSKGASHQNLCEFYQVFTAHKNHTHIRMHTITHTQLDPRIRKRNV